MIFQHICLIQETEKLRRNQENRKEKIEKNQKEKIEKESRKNQEREKGTIMELQKGRPKDTAGRLEKEIRTYDLLDKLGVAYERVDHAPAMTMEVCQEIDKVLQATICKNLFLCNRQETKFYLLMIPDTKVFHTKDLSAKIGSARLSFAKPEYMEKFLDITPGSVSVLGLMNDTENHVQLLIDEDVLKSEFVGCHPCINTSSIRFHTSDLIEKVLPAVNHDFIMVTL
mgnify:FL=1